jgi:succinate dehydrogenase / fumarate reductase cytochrome b subunit
MAQARSSDSPPATGQRAYRQQRPLVLEVGDAKPAKPAKARTGRGDRPMSPHITIYRPQLTSVLSIFHRLTGVFLASGAAMLCCWLLMAAAGPDYYAGAMWFLTSWIGYILLFGWSFCLFYHLCNGVRHLFWDIGVGLSIPATYASGALMVGAALGLTGASWAIGLAVYFSG